MQLFSELTLPVTSHENFASWVLNAVESTSPITTYPQVYEDRDGDRIEIYLSADDFIADWLDRRLTVFRDRRSGDAVGGAIQGITSMLELLCSKLPGFAFNIRDSKIDLNVVLTAAQLCEQNDAVSMHYLALSKTLALRGVAISVPTPINKPDEAGCE